MGEAKRRGTRDQRVAALLGESGVVSLTPERYNAFVAWTRTPTADLAGKELEFLSNKAETLIGVLIKDRSDRDFGFVVLGRDLKGRFRCIDVSVSMTRTEARHALFASLRTHTDGGDAVFPQDDEEKDTAGVDLFGLQAPEENLHSAFRLLRSADHWTPARAIMSEMMRHFVDVDGNFVQQFQTTAFDSRIWELYLYAALLDSACTSARSTRRRTSRFEQGVRRCSSRPSSSGDHRRTLRWRVNPMDPRACVRRKKFASY